MYSVQSSLQCHKFPYLIIDQEIVLDFDISVLIFSKSKFPGNILNLIFSVVWHFEPHCIYLSRALFKVTAAQLWPNLTGQQTAACWSSTDPYTTDKKKKKHESEKKYLHTVEIKLVKVNIMRDWLDPLAFTW